MLNTIFNNHHQELDNQPLVTMDQQAQHPECYFNWPFLMNFTESNTDPPTLLEMNY